MYPSQGNPGYGVFVKNVKEGLEGRDVHTKYLAVISERDNSLINKWKTYIVFYASILRDYFKCYDCLYVHYPSYSAPILYFLHRIKRKPLVVNFHGEDLLYPVNTSFHRYLGRMSERLARRADFIVVPTEYYKDIVFKRGIAEKQTIVVSPSGGIDTNIFKFVSSKEKRNYIHLGYVGRLQKDKGILEFVEVCKLLSTQIKIKATIIGYGPLYEDVLKNIKDTPDFTLIRGLDQSELPAYYSDFDLFCFPSQRKSESLGLVGLEAMACGTPVLGTDIGGIKSYVKHGENGFLLRIDNLVNDMIGFCTKYYNWNDEERSNMINCAIETAKRYSRDNVCLKLASEFLDRIRIE